MKTKNLLTALALIIGLQFTNAQKFINENVTENKQSMQILPIFSSNSSEWEIVKYNGIQSNLSAIQFIDDKHGWAVGAYGTIINTTDGGLTWKEQSLGYIVQLKDLHFLNENTGFVVGIMYVGPHIYGIAFKTVDGGKNWNLSFQSDTPMVLNSIAFSDDQNGFLSGNSYGPNPSEGIIIKTTDTGLTWENVSINNTILKIDNIMFNHKGNGKSKGMTLGFATAKINVGPSEVSVILKSMDLGISWNTVYSNYGNNISDMSFFNYNQGIAVADNGTILLTNDAGESWTAKKYDPYKYNATLAGEENDSWVVGDDGTILKSTNQGQKWLVQYNLLNTNLNAICRTPGGNLWIVGDDGTLMKKLKSTIIDANNQDLVNSSINEDTKSTQISNQTEKNSGPLVKHKNYPNPFSSKTTISFQLSQQAYVKLDIYNINGKLITTLKDQNLDTGYYEVMLDGSDLPSGIYTYVLRTGSHVENGKMIK